MDSIATQNVVPRRAMPATRLLGYALGAFFIATGLLKLFASSREIVPGAAMLSHPAWFRIVVGIAETICGGLLFLPAAAAFGAVGLALLMFGAAGTRLVTGEGGILYPVILLVLLAVVAWDARPDDVQAEIDQELGRSHPLLKEAVVAGALGAVAIAIWFLVVDSIAGHPLQTPLTLGRALLSLLGPAPSPDADFVVVGLYTVFHFVAFIAVAIVAEWLVYRAQTQPAVLAGALMLFVAVELLFYGFVALLQETTGLGTLVWWQVMVGNLIAAAIMGTYIWKKHPELADELRHTLEGTV